MKKTKYNVTKMFPGFRVGKKNIRKLNLKALEKCSVLTDLQHDIVQYHRNMCTNKNSSEKHRKRLDVLLSVPVEDAHVNQFGNLWEKQKAVINKKQPTGQLCDEENKTKTLQVEDVK